jgi:hypothetical protein
VKERITLARSCELRSGARHFYIANSVVEAGASLDRSPEEEKEVARPGRPTGSAINLPELIGTMTAKEHSHP